MDKFSGIFGVIAILGIAYLLSNNRKAINWRIIGSGLLIQLLLALFVLKTQIGSTIFSKAGALITTLLKFSDKGGEFVFGPLMNNHLLTHAFGAGNDFIFVFKVAPTIIFVSALVSLAYHLGIMQFFISIIAKVVLKLMGVSGSEALSNAGSVFVGQVEAQILIKPYVPGMTMSELMASMAGSFACISGGVMAVYISMGIPAQYLLTASIMAAPGALVIAKMVYPETEKSETKGEIKLHVENNSINVIDALAHGASDGMKISINVIAMLIGFVAVINMFDASVAKLGLVMGHMGVNLGFIGVDVTHISLKGIIGSVFSIFAWLMGVPWKDAGFVGQLMGTKLVLNEFVAYLDLLPAIKGTAAATLSPKSIAIATFALCGFANLSSVAIQIGGIGQLAPTRAKDLAKIGLKALVCGTMASYLSATIAGILLSF
ncbi:MAG: nucleoside transporter C-terminal domain-containing protein [bacterium]